MSKGIFAAAQAVFVGSLAFLIATTAAQAGGGASRSSKCYTDEELNRVVGTRYDASALISVDGDANLSKVLRDQLTDTPDPADAAEIVSKGESVQHLAASWAAKTQKNGPLMLLDTYRCEWKVSSGKDLMALWSIEPHGFFLYVRPAARSHGAGGNQVAPAPPPITVSMPKPIAFALADPAPVQMPGAASPDRGSSKADGAKPSGGGFLKNVVAADTGEDLMLRQLGRLKDVVDGPSLSVGPPKSGSHASYDYEFKGALGYKFGGGCSNVSDAGACIGPVGARFDELSLTAVPFASVWYGTEKNPGGSGNLQIDRFSLGTVLESGIVWGDDYKSRTDLDVQSGQLASDRSSYGLMLQVIPQFITDHRFEAKIAYVEGRMDVAHLPSWSWCFANGFDGINYSNVGPHGNFPAGGDDDGAADGNWGNVTCSAGLIMDYAHQFRVGLQNGLLNSFARLGYDVGLSFKPITDCDSSAFADCHIAKGFSFQVGYRNLWDYSGEAGNVYRFTSSLKYTFPGSGDDADSGKGPTISVSYTDGVEDITLAPIPTWKLSFSTGN